MLTIKNVEKGSIAEELKLNNGDILSKIDNKEIVDILDITFIESKESFSLTVIKKNGKIVNFDIDKDIDEELGINFVDDCYLTPNSCDNNCIFCFVDQLPCNMRDTLYVKDDDYRLSFVSGNYVTLTNLHAKDIDRIKEKHFSPLYISVHTTNDNLRKSIIGCDYTIKLMDLLTEFKNANISMHCQIVMCPQINDGQILLDSLTDLYTLYPAIKSVAVVPVGLTQYRKNLPQLKPVDKTIAIDTINLVETFANNVYKKCGKHFAYCSDEFYVKADMEVPSYDYYEAFEQIENGVGLLKKFETEFLDALNYSISHKNESYTIVTGVSAEAFLNKLLFALKNKFPKAKCDIISITNNFFGNSITVAGLVVGNDIITQLQGRKLNDIILIPKCMLKEFDDVFLDGTSLVALEEKIGKKVLVIDIDGYNLVETITQGE